MKENIPRWMAHIQVTTTDRHTNFGLIRESREANSPLHSDALLG